MSLLTTEYKLTSADRTCPSCPYNLVNLNRLCDICRSGEDMFSYIWIKAACYVAAPCHEARHAESLIA